MGFIISGEELAVALAPVAVYWIYSGVYVALGSAGALDRYRLHSRRDEETKNMASKKDVVKGVLLQQAIQVAISLAVLKQDGGDDGVETGQASTPAAAAAAAAALLGVAARFGVAMVVLDTWQYFMHRLMHASPYMYQRFHSRHHRVVAPYAFLTETLSGAAAFLASGMAAAFFALATVKGIDDHCGLMLPWNPLHAAFGNNTAYHDVHHQRGGGRRNLSQPFFVVWDRLLGTHAGYVVLATKDGGLEAKAMEDYRHVA
uniref:aldehyde oxygenase (deformylating) n=1 Tax=Oryza brachyantha TaxID=4533 RepID=J3L2J1_ORYBR